MNDDAMRQEELFRSRRNSLQRIKAAEKQTTSIPSTFTVESGLFVRAAKGDLAAFEQILFLYEKAIFNYALRLVNQWQDAQDVTQETFVKVYQHLRTIDAGQSPKAWIYRIATNTARDWLRKRTRRRELFIIDDETSNFETFDPRQTYDNREEQSDARVAQALGQLKPRYKSILLLFYQQEMTYQEIAVALSLPLNTVKTYLRRAKQSLKKELQTFHE